MAYFIGKERKTIFETHFTPISIFFFIFQKVLAEISMDEKLLYEEEIKRSRKMKDTLSETDEG